MQQTNERSLLLIREVVGLLGRMQSMITEIETLLDGTDSVPMDLPNESLEIRHMESDCCGAPVVQLLVGDGMADTCTACNFACRLNVKGSKKNRPAFMAAAVRRSKTCCGSRGTRHMKSCRA